MKKNPENDLITREPSRMERVVSRLVRPLIQPVVRIKETEADVFVDPPALEQQLSPQEQERLREVGKEAFFASPALGMAVHVRKEPDETRE
ncbi:MAG: hypothetical protein U5L95_03700 [Candidatus Saccharibacteria bacterium]|nr:hypothetical protein [Candidatus Saccharibacteria bacterium]